MNNLSSIVQNTIAVGTYREVRGLESTENWIKVVGLLSLGNWFKSVIIEELDPLP